MEIITPSNLGSFGKCPRQYYEATVLKLIPYVKNASSLRGKAIHGAIEACFKEGWDDGFWPDGENMARTRMRRHYDALIKLPEHGWQVSIEQNEAIDWHGQPIDFWHKEKDCIFARCTLDYQALNYSLGRGILFDWKTGKTKGTDTQFHLNAIMTAARTGIRHFTATYVYLDQGLIEPPREIIVQDVDLNPAAFTRQMYMDSIANGTSGDGHHCLSTLNEIIKLREAYQSGVWPELGSGFVCHYCDVKECDGHNRKQRRK